MEDHRSYLFFDFIDTKLRAFVSVLLIGTGFLFQVSTHNILAGLPFVVACLLFNLLKGVSVPKVIPTKLAWHEVTPQRIAEVAAHCARIKKFQGSQVGCVVIIVIAVFVVTFVMPLLRLLLFNLPFSVVAALFNTMILFAGIALSGRKTAWMPHALDTKIDVVQRFLTAPAVVNDPGIQIIPYLEMGQSSDGSFPNDARFMIRFKDASKDFIGLQGQISINAVKGTVYPYFYVVMIAKHAFRLFERFNKKNLDKCVIERKKTPEVDVIVIRQHTTKTSGYHTDEKMQKYILENCIRFAKAILI